jgi:hypothetical protein
LLKKVTKLIGSEVKYCNTEHIVMSFVECVCVCVWRGTKYNGGRLDILSLQVKTEDDEEEGGGGGGGVTLL